MENSIRPIYVRQTSDIHGFHWTVTKCGRTEQNRTEQVGKRQKFSSASHQLSFIITALTYIGRNVYAVGKGSVG